MLGFSFPRGADLARRFDPVEAVLLVFAIAAAVGLFSVGRGPEKAREITVELTVLVSDAKSLACARDGTEPVACGYDGHLRPRRIKRPARQFVTTAHELVYLTGVFEPLSIPAGAPDRRLRLRCTVRVRGRIDRAQLRWQPRGPWGQSDQPGLAGDAQKCTVVE